MNDLSSHIEHALSYHCGNLETIFEAPVLSYVGQIHTSYNQIFVSAIEGIVDRVNAHEPPFKFPRRLILVLTTPGGIAEAVERMVEIIRHHFDEVYFVVPYYAMSAGTIFCMSGDKIFMDYTSALGPIDPQVANPDQHLVPALGYLDKVNEMIQKSNNDELSTAEMVMLQRLDLATLRRYEQARDLSISLLVKWLVRYKFKDWVRHETHNPGAPVVSFPVKQTL